MSPAQLRLYSAFSHKVIRSDLCCVRVIANVKVLQILKTNICLGTISKKTKVSTFMSCDHRINIVFEENYIDVQ